MKDGHCPKCQAQQVYRGIPLADEGKIHFAAFPNNQMVTLYVNAYVCVQCGYVEMYVADNDKDKLGAIAADSHYWQKVG